MSARVSDFQEDVWCVGRPRLSKGSWVHDGTHRESVYRHPYTIVEISEYIGGTTPFTSMTFNSGGIQYSRRWEAQWGDLTLARLAREFVEDVFLGGQS